MTEMNLNPAQRQYAGSGIDPAVRVFHVGGRGGMGPIESLFGLGKDLSLSIFEANIESGDDSWADYQKIIDDYAQRYGIKVSVIPRCLSDCVGSKEFHINVMPDCSSLLKMSPDAAKYSRMDRGQYRIIWGEICQPTKTIEIDVTTLDKLYSEGAIQLPHFLSLDVQGAEYNILEGATQALESDLVGVVSEVEFRELYQGQKLFMDQYALLRKHRFNLFELYNTEYWYSGPIFARGALTVGEALFLRDFNYFIAKYKEPAPLLSNLSKLAIVAYYFNRRSYAFEIMVYIMENWREAWNTIVKQSDSGYLHTLAGFYQDIKALQPEMEKIPTYREFMARGPVQRGSTPLQKLTSITRLAYNVNLKMIVDKLRRTLS